MANQSPFLDIKSFANEFEENPETNEGSFPARSPFLTLYEAEDGGQVAPETEEFVTFLNQLYDEEFDEVLSNLVDEAAELYEAQFPFQQEDPRATGYQAERLLNQHFAPLAAESEAMFGRLAREFEHRDAAVMSEEEIENLVDSYQPTVELSPNFEEFFGKLKKLAKGAVKLAKKGISAVAKLGLGPILEKLKALVKPLLQRVVTQAIGRLPAHLQPMARQLAEKLPFLKEFEDEDESEAGHISPVSSIQNEFNQQVAELLFAHDETEQDLEVARVLSRPPAPDSYPLAELDLAREKFSEQLGNLREGEDPTPLMEDFLPAILPALRIGLRLAGRKRVVDFLARFLARLIQKFIGPQHAPALSQAIVDAGLRLLQLEAEPESESRAAASAVTAMVEETVRRVAALPDYVLDNQELLEGYALEAFEQAAASNLPPVLPDETYRKHPQLGEAVKRKGVWLMLPNGRRRKRYKKYSRRIMARITPHKVAELETLEGAAVDEFLEEQLGVAPGEEVEAVVHLYEAIAGTRMADIVREEAIARAGSLSQHTPLHPLTREAAALLVGEPELGRDEAEGSAGDPHSLPVGQRYYYLEIPGKRPLTTPAQPGQAKATPAQPRRKTRTRLVLDFPKNEARVTLFLSEVRAQELVVKLRQHTHTGVVTARLHRIIQRGLRHALITGRYARLKIIHEAVKPGQYAEALRRLPTVVPQVLLGRLTEWVVKGLADYLKKGADEVKKAAEDTADGITLVITLKDPPGFSGLRQALKAKGISPNSLKIPEGTPEVRIKIFPGYRNE